VYKAFADGDSSANRRRDVFRCIVTCMNASPEAVWRVLKVEALSRTEAEEVVGRFYGKDGSST
jgi:hypothetical protein